jgi:hypothetical protein
MKSKLTRLISLLLLAALFVVAAVALARPALPAPETSAAAQAQGDLFAAKGLPRERYMAEANESPEMEGQFLNSVGDYWAVRASYPTGVFDQQWLVDAAETDKLIQEALPAGALNASRLVGGGNLDPNQFTALGPQPLQSDGCQNCFNYGIVAGRTNVMVSDPVAPNIAYAGSDGGGVWKTTNCCDENTTWTVVTDDPLIANTTIGDLTLDPNDHNTIYAGTGDLRYGSWSFGSAGVLKSSDAGATWEVLGEDVFGPNYPQPPGVFPQYQSIGKVRVDPRDSDNVVVTTKTGVYFSYDAGLNWSGPCLTNPHSTQRQDGTGLILHDNGTSTDVYVAIGTRGSPTPVQPNLDQNGANGIYHTTMPTSGCPAVGDWTLITRGDNGFPVGTGNGTPNNPSQVGRIDMAMAPSNPDVIYAVVADTTLSNGLLRIYRTDNGGTTWIAGTNFDNGSTQNWYDQNVIVDPTDPMVIFVDMIDIFRSTNGGASLTNITQGYSGGDVVHVDHHGLAYVNNDPDRLLASSDGGAYYTDVATDPGLSFNDFVRLNETFNTIEFYSGDITADFNTSSSPAINGGAQDNGSMVKVWDVGGGEPVEAAEWQVTTGGDGMFARIEPKLGNNWYQESQNGGLKRSTNGPFGPYSNLPTPWAGDRLSFIMPYELDKYNCPNAICDHMIVGTHRVWESINAGTTFLVNSPDLTKGTLGARSFIQQLSYAVNNGSIAIAGTLDGNVQYGFNLGQGVANSATWVNVTGGNTVLPNRPIMDVATHPNIATTGFAAVGGFNENTPTTPGHVFQVTCNSDCSSFTWADKTGNLPNIPVNSIIANPNIPSQVFAGTDWGLYFTDDITAATPTWNLFTAGLPRVMIWDMAIDRGFTTLALFTRARGAYVWPLPQGLDFTLTVEPPSQNICIPDDALYDVTVGQTLNFTDTVNLSVTGVPAGYTGSFGVNSGTPPFTTTLTLANTGAATGGNYALNVIGVAPTSTHTTTVQLNLLDGAPAGVTLVAPANGATNVPVQPTFSWQAGGVGVIDYLLEVADDAGFTNIIYSTTVADTSHTPPVNLPDGTLLYWRVRASNACGLGQASATFSFTTIELTNVCPIGSVPAVAYETSFEDGAADWMHDGTGDTWALATDYASDGTYSYKALDTETLSDQRLTSPVITLGPATQSPVTLQFTNRQRFEPPSTDGRCWDAGILEISTDGGTSWSYIDNSHMLTDPYDNVIWNDQPGNNPITNDYGAVEAWCTDDGTAFDAAIVNLDDYAGQSVQLRWRIGTDSAVGNDGWWIDQVSVQSCVPAGSTPAITVSPDALDSTQTPDTTTSQTLTISNTGDVDLTWSITEVVGLNGPTGNSWADSFDTYATDSQLHGQGGWKGWNNSPAAGAFTTDDQARSLPNSVDIVGGADLVHEYTGFNSGQYVYTAWQYIPSSFTGQTYFILLNTYVDNGTNNWSTQVCFNSNTDMLYDDTGATCTSGDSLPIVYDEWVEIRVEIDLDADTQTFYYGGQMLYQAGWTGHVSTGGVLNIAAVDLFANNATSVYYDDISLIPRSICETPSEIPWLSASPTSGTTAAGGASTVDVTFDSTGLAVGTYNGTLCVASNDPLTPYVETPVSLIVVPEPVYGVELTAVDNTLTGTADAVVTYTLHITNTGDTADSYTLSSDGNAWMTDLSTTSVALAAGASDEVMVMVHVPVTATNNATDTVTITATSDADSSVMDSVDLTTTADVELPPQTDTFIYLPIIVKPDSDAPEAAAPKPTANVVAVTAVLPLFALLFWRRKE